MTRRAYIGAAAIVVAVAAWLLLRSSGDGASGRGSGSNGITTSAAEKGASGGATASAAQAPASRADESPASAEPRLSRREQLPGESASHYRSRKAVLESYDRFVREAELTPEQEARVLGALADVQANHRIQHGDAPGEIDDSYVPSMDGDSLRAEHDFWRVLGEFLTPEQVEVWKDTVASSTVFVLMGGLDGGAGAPR